MEAWDGTIVQAWDNKNWDNKNWGISLAWRTHAVNSSLVGKKADLELEKTGFRV